MPIPCGWETPDLLIGSKFYYEFNIVKKCVLPSGFVLLNSILAMIGRQSNACENYIQSINVAITLNIINKLYI